MTIAHLSDLHFGRIAHPGIVDALVTEVNAEAPDLVALSGDLTQRARRGEFEAARSMLQALKAETMVVPGNHDVFPWWRPVRRLTEPLARYRTYVTDDLTPTYQQNGVFVLGINSAHGRTIKGGRITGGQLAAMEQTLGAADPKAFKVLVLHHHLTKIRALGRHDVARRAQKALNTAVESGVDLILCGHLHISHIEPVEIIPGQHRVVVASAGTATSNRGRKSNRETNFYNRIRIEPDAFSIEERRYVPERSTFVSDSVTTFERNGEG